jgi:hypothetical protein
MTDDFDPQLDQFPEDPLSYVPPQLEPEEVEASRVLARLIQFAYVPAPVPDLPPAWRQAFEDVLLARSRPRGERLRAFFESIQGKPDFILMHRAINDAMPDIDDRLAQNRIVYTADDALKPPPELQWCVQDMFAQPSLTMLVGNPGTKKTFLAIDLAVCVALGQPWLGRSVNQGPVFFIDEETGLHQLWSRFNSALKAHDSGWGVPLNFVSLGGYDLRNEEDADVLIHRALSVNARLIIIDALANLMRGTGENNLATVQPVLFNLRRMAEYCQAAVLVIHHTNRHGLFRGSSSISAAADLMLSIESDPADTLLTLRTLKARFLAPLPFCARANFAPAPDGTPRFHLTPTDEKPADSPQSSLASGLPGVISSILDLLTRHPGLTRSQITARLSSYSSGTIRNSLHRLMVSGLIQKSMGQEKAKEPGYELSEGSELDAKDLDNV